MHNSELVTKLHILSFCRQPANDSQTKDANEYGVLLTLLTKRNQLDPWFYNSVPCCTE